MAENKINSFEEWCILMVSFVSHASGFLPENESGIFQVINELYNSNVKLKCLSLKLK